MNDFIPNIFSLENNLPKIKAPELILWSAQDKILDISSVSVFEKGLANHKTVIIKDCGLVPMVEKPLGTANAYLPFIKNTGK
jgi:abhydrolase domain-containing protein 6